MSRPYKEGDQLFKKPCDISIEKALALERKRVNLKRTVKDAKYQLRLVTFELKQMEFIERYGYYVGRCSACRHSIYLNAKTDTVLGHIDKNGRASKKCEMRTRFPDSKCGCGKGVA